MNPPSGIVALIELGNSHDECIYSQILFLNKADYTVHLLLSEGLKTQAANFPTAAVVHYFSLPAKGIQAWSELFKIKQYLKKHAITHVVLNTATGNTIRNFILLNLFTSIPFAGTVHHTGKLNKSFTQRLISLKVKKYFVLNDYLLDSIKKQHPLRIASYYPIFFPAFEPVAITKATSEFWICIPGQLEFKRRDYKSLFSQLQKHKLPIGFKFILLGRCNHKYGNGEEVKLMIKEQQLEDHFIVFDQFIDNALFHAYLKLSDVVLPLIHEGSEGFKSYATAQISGAFNLAFAYQKPMLMHQYFNFITDFQVSSFFYSPADLVALCLQLYANPSLCTDKAAAIAGYYKFSFVVQQQKYLQLLTLA